MSDKPQMCVDFDGVISSWGGGTFYRPGPPIDGAREFLADLSSFSRVVICTCRTNSELYDEPTASLVRQLKAWFVRHDLWQYVHAIHTGPGKVFAAGYIDDKGIHCDPESGGPREIFDATLIAARAFCQNGKEKPNKSGEK